MMTYSHGKIIIRRFAGLTGRVLGGLVVSSLVAVMALRFISPCASAFMVERYCHDLFSSRGLSPINYHWVDWDHISPHMALAAVAAEDQKFPHHYGFDFASMSAAVKKSQNGGRLRGASTISQQVAKNLFLWKGRSFIRKGLEAYFTVLLESLWPKQRILEIYLNIAEFGDGIYGVDAAAKKFFGKPAARLSKREAALLSAVLPNPIRLKANKPSAYVLRRTRSIERQMRNLGPAYVQGL